MRKAKNDLASYVTEFCKIKKFIIVCCCLLVLLVMVYKLNLTAHSPLNSFLNEMLYNTP